MTMTAIDTWLPSSIDNTTHLTVGWAVTDANGHMRSTAYLDAVNDCRFLYFHRAGWTLERLHAARLGPILIAEEITYRRELRTGASATIEQALAGLSPDGARWKLRNTVRRDADGTVAAAVTSTGAWIDLDRRRLIEPPADLLAAFDALPRTDDFESLASLELSVA
jgi:acyl-CoA thioester hydrolase